MRIACLTAACLSAFQCLPAALAQTGPPRSTDPYDDREEPPPNFYDEIENANAAKHYKAGAALAKKGEWEKAYPEMVSAWDSFRHWQIAASLAKVEVEVGKYRDALRHLTFARESGKVPEGDRPAIERAFERAKRSMGTIDLRATCDKTAEVLLDGEKLGDAPFEEPTLVDPGTHVIEVRSGVRHVRGSVDVAARKVVKLSLHLEIPLPPVEKKVKPPPPPTTLDLRMPFAVGLSALSASGFVVGALLYGNSRDAAGRVGRLMEGAPSGQCPTFGCDAARQELQRRDDLQVGAIASFTIGGMATLGSGILWAMLVSDGAIPKKRSTPQAWVLPLASPDHGGLLLQGAF
ncbi:MAG: hypothetical protein R3F14_24090 [Polyangiaceae bacterium]